MEDGRATVHHDRQQLTVLSSSVDRVVVAFECEQGDSHVYQGKATLTASANGVQFDLAQQPDSGGPSWACNGDWDLQFGAWTRR